MDTKKQLQELFDEYLELMCEEDGIALLGFLKGLIYLLKKKQD